MDSDREERIKAIKQQLTFVSASLKNAESLLNAGKVVASATIEDLMISQAALKAKLEAAESGADKTPDISPASKETEVGIPEHLRIKRHYTMTPAAMAQRKHAAKQKQPNMKGNKNAWKHGNSGQNYIASFIKPCKSSCPDYPCEIIVQGGTKPGGDCLSRAGVIQSYRAIIDGVKNKKYEDFNDMAALVIAKNIQAVQDMFDDIQRDGAFIKEERYDKDGEVCGARYVPHPNMLALPKLLQAIGLTPGEMMLTPKALATKETDDKGVKTIADLMSSLGSSMKKQQAPDEDD